MEQTYNWRISCAGCGRETNIIAAIEDRWAINTRIQGAMQTGYWCPECQKADKEAGPYDYMPLEPNMFPDVMRLTDV